MQKYYKGKNLSLGTWPTTGTGFQLAVGAWRTFMNEFTSLKAADVPADDDRLKGLVEAAQQAASRGAPAEGEHLRRRTPRGRGKAAGGQAREAGAARATRDGRGCVQAAGGAAG